MANVIEQVESANIGRSIKNPIAVLKPFDVLKKYWYLIVLLIIVVSAYQLREIPNRFGILPDIDTYFIYRLSNYILENNFQLPERDMLRNYPYGDDFFDRRGALYTPAIIYVLLNPFLNISFFQFAFIFPSLMGALSVLVMFFVCKELFNSKKAGLFGAFFLGTVVAYFTRTSTGEIEKEAISAPFLFLTFLFFIKSFKESNWKRGLVYGILSGLFLGVTGSIWGGVQIVLLLYGIFAFVLLLLNQNTKNLFVSYIPTIFIGIGIIWATPSAVGTLVAYFIPLGIAAILLLRVAAERFRLVNEKQLRFLPLGITIIALVAILIGSIFIDTLNTLIDQAIDKITLKSAQLTTVAESIPGDWNIILGSTGITYTSLPNLAGFNPIFSLWFLYFLGSIVLLYRLYKTRDLLILFPLIFLVASIQSVFFGIRFTYMLGIPAALIGGFFTSWIIDKSFSIKTIGKAKATWILYFIFGLIMLFGAYTSLGNQVVFAGFLVPALLLLFLGFLLMRSEGQDSIFKRIYNTISNKLPSGRIDLILIPIIIFISITVALNFENAKAHASSLGPSINQPILEAMDFLRTQTPEGSSVFSWWDFGYWFQTVGQRPTILDGGGAGAISRYDAALFFTDRPENWDNWKPTLISNLSYILMDYTLPGKYGAITKIASNGEQVVGFVQFNPKPNIFQNNGNLIYEYVAPPYSIWLPVRGNTSDTLALAGPPVFLVSQNGQYIQRSYINDICTVNGIIRAGNRTDSIGGCVSISNLGIFYIPEVAEHTMFSRLMFMEGADLPIEKVFDNVLVKIYKVNN